MNCSICGESLDRIEEDYIVNDSHLLCLITTEENK